EWLPHPPATRRAENLEMARLVQLYAGPLNWRDGEGLRELITADARLLVADRFAGPLADAPYFSRYERMTTPWRMAVGEVDGQMAVVGLRQVNGVWTPYTIVSVQMTGALITQVVDYLHCPLVLSASNSVVADPC